MRNTLAITLITLASIGSFTGGLLAGSSKQFKQLPNTENMGVMEYKQPFVSYPEELPQAEPGDLLVIDHTNADTIDITFLNAGYIDSTAVNSHYVFNINHINEINVK